MPSICSNCNAPTTNDEQRFCYRCGYELRPGSSGGLNSELPPAESNAVTSGAVTPVEPVSASPHQPNIDTPSESAKPQNTVGAGGPFEITLASVKPDSDNQQKALLKILLPSGDLFDRELTKVETQIGKGPRNDIVIADPAVSTSHAVLRADGNSYSVQDVGSRNGTYVNGERLTESRQLNHGDVIGIGLTKLTLRLTGQSDTGTIQTTDVLTAPVFHHTPPPLTEESLAQAVFNEGITTRAHIDRVRNGRRLYRTLIDDGLMSDETLRDLMSRVFRIPVINLRSEPINEDTAISFPSKLARDYWVFAYREEGGKLLLAIADPTDTDAIERVKSETRLDIDLRLASSSEIAEQIDKFYGPKLIGVLPSGEKIRFLVNSHEIGIGKAPHNDLVVADPTVSNTHAVLLFRDDCYSVVDLGSRNGTYVNGERVTNHARTLRHGDSIQMGQTVLTFRNSGETAENITATLSMESLEEVRRRASLEHGLDKSIPPSSGNRNAQVAPVNTPQFAAPPVAPEVAPPAEIAVKEGKEHKEHKEGKEAKEVKSADGAEEHEDEKGDKKKKKKDKSEERIRAAYVGAVSRIIAQITGAILTAALTVIVAYYFSRNMGSQSSNSGTHSIPGVKSKFTNPGHITPIRGGRHEASGVAHVPDTNGVLFVDDGESEQVFWMELDQSGNQVGDVKAVPLGVTVGNPEGIVYGGGFFYVVGSQGDPGSGNVNALARFAFDANSKTLKGTPEVISDLRGFLLARISELKGEGEKNGIEGGLNIEGIAWDPDPGRERLLLGLRSPLINNQAIIVPIRMADVRSFTAESIHLSDPPTIPISLGGMGIRAIQYDSQLKAFLIVSGAPDPLPKTEFKLWEWSGRRNSEPVEVASLDSKMKPEGVTSVRIGGRDYVLVFGDDSSFMKFDYASGQ